MSFFKKTFKKVTKVATGGIFGSKIFGALKRGLEAPGTEGLSESERRALDEARLADEERRKRLSEGMRRRARIALGVSGGQRSLLFGGLVGAPQPPAGGSTASGPA